MANQPAPEAWQKVARGERASRRPWINHAMLDDQIVEIGMKAWSGNLSLIGW